MQVRNNYDIEWNKDEETGTGIYNGDIGIIRMIDRNAGVMAIDFDKRIAYYTFDLAKELDLAYAVTVHKSQGNEFNAVILPLMGGYEKLYYRNLLYTAVTRARKILIIVGSRYWVEYMVHNNKKLLRYTGLKNFIRQMVLGEGEK